MKYLNKDYYVIERNGEYWSDYLTSKSDCKREIEEDIKLGYGHRGEYSYRLMVDEDVIEQYPEVIENMS